MTRLNLLTRLTMTAPVLMAAAEMVHRGAAVPLPTTLRDTESLGHGVTKLAKTADTKGGLNLIRGSVDKSASAVAAKLMGDDDGHVTRKASTGKSIRSHIAGLPGSCGNIASDLPGLLGRIGALAAGKSVAQHA